MSKKLITALLLITSMLLNMFVAVNTYAYTASGDEILIYVAPDGNDKNQGTIDAPLKTFAGAKHRVRQAAGSKTIRVIFREGQYNITESQYFDMRDSGRKNAPVIYEAYEGEKVVLSGATRLNPNDFKKVEDKEILMRIPVDARDNVLQMDLKKYGINKLITMKEMVESAVSAGYDSSSMIGYLLLDNKEQMVAQWPNGDGAYDYMGKVYLKGSTTSFKVNMEGAACVAYTKDRCDLWKNAIGDAYFQIYPHNDYRAEILALVDLDTIEKKMYISGGSQGFDETRNKARYKILNLLEELDVPTEYFVDREKMILQKRFFDGRTQIEVAEEIGISQAQVSRVEKCALEHIRKQF